MKLEDENFEEEFLNWLNNKSNKELIDSLKKYAIEEQCIYKMNNLFYIEEYNSYNKIESQQIELDKEAQNIKLNDKIIEDKGENKEWMKEEEGLVA